MGVLYKYELLRHLPKQKNLSSYLSGGHLMQSLLQWISALKDKEVFSKTKLINATKYDNFAFWWFLRLRLYTDLSIIFGSKNKLYRQSRGRHLISKLSRFYLLSVILLSIFAKFFFPRKTTKKNTKKRVFVTFNYGDSRGFRDISTGKYLRGHSLFGPIIRRLSRKDFHTEFLSSYPFGYSFFSFVKLALDIRSSKCLTNFSPLESYFSWKSLIRVLRARSAFSRTYSKITMNEMRKHVFQYYNIDIFTEFQTNFEYYFKVYLPLMVEYYELCLRLLEKEKPNLVLLSNEYGGFERALLFACHRMKIPTLAQQHGVIHVNHPGYMFEKGAISTQEYTTFPFSPLPTITSIIGPAFKKILTEDSSFPKSRVAISGQPRYDVFHVIARIYDKDTFFKRHNLDQKKKMVLLATQPFYLETLRREFLINTIHEISLINGIQIVVKPHHNESIEWFNKQLRPIQADVMVLPPESDVIEAIYVCDVFMSVNSTTILEALALDKPVVVVNLSSQIEPLPWVKKGAALGVYNVEEIKSAAEKALFDDRLRNQLQDKRTKFVFEYLYKIDGKATDRVISLMLKLAK
jgi:hypothetical protein